MENEAKCFTVIMVIEQEEDPYIEPTAKLRYWEVLLNQWSTGKLAGKNGTELDCLT